MRKGSLLVLVLSLVAGVAGLAGGVWWFGVRPGQLLEQAADRIVAGLASGELADTDVTDPAAVDLEQVFTGMGALRPTVARATELVPREPGVVTTTLDWSWTIHEGKAAWEYSTPLELMRDGEDWRARLTPATIAPDLGEGESLRATRLAPTRGSILGQGGEPLATNTPAWRLGIDKTLTDVDTAADSAGKLATELGLDAEAFADRVRRSGPRAFVEARILRQHVPEDQELVARTERWIGVRAVPTTFPLGRTSSFARPLLGVVGDATAEQVEKSGGTIRPGDLVGRGGLQEARNHVLAGTTGFVVSIVDADGRAREAFRVEALDGAHVLTTIDVGLQVEAERILAEVGPASALVAIRPSDGAVLAAASGPGSDGLSTATLGQYAPGSTFKTVSALALLRAGEGADAPVECSDGVVVDGYRFDNWEGYPSSALGTVPLHTALAHSCNSAFINERDRLTHADVADAAGALGLTAEPNLVVGGFLGAVPEGDTEVEHAASLIGQGKVLASPLGMATVMASVVAGHAVSPVLVDEPGAAAEPASPLTEAEASALRSLLANNPVEGGYGALTGLDGVLAKTGTATYAPGQYHAWLMAARGDLAVAAFVADGSSGGRDAAPLAAALLRAA
ncbi:MAG TPA: penicillin-binding protein [Propionibacterium sp.]|nr:penicillin-binding protein [Propionibacterium sp.]